MGDIGGNSGGGEDFGGGDDFGGGADFGGGDDFGGRLLYQYKAADKGMGVDIEGRRIIHKNTTYVGPYWDH